MTEQNPFETFETLLAYKAHCANLNIDAIFSTHQKAPRFLRAYARKAEQFGGTSEAAFSRDLDKMFASKYPGPHCLRPHEIEAYSCNGLLSKLQTKHIAECDACAALVAASAISESKLADFLDSVRAAKSKRPSRSSPQTPTIVSAPLNTGPLLNRDPDPIDLALRILGQTLHELALTLNARSSRRVVFRGVTQHIKDKYPSRSTWDVDFVLQADENRWPGWAVESLPNLYISLSEQGTTALVWHYLVACIPRTHQCEIVDELCQGLVYEVKLRKVTALLISRLAPMFEENRNGNPFPSNQSMRNVVLETLIHASYEANACDPNGIEGRELENARQEMMKSPACLPDFDQIVNALELLADASPKEYIHSVDVVRTLYPDYLKELRRLAQAKGRFELAKILTT